MFTISDRLRELRYEVLSSNPSDYQMGDLNKFGQELNELRVVLARLANVHNGTGKITGWGHLEGTVPGPWLARKAAEAARQAENDGVVVPDDDEPPTRRPSRSRTRAVDSEA